jgi:hypothetical protein
MDAPSHTTLPAPRKLATKLPSSLPLVRLSFTSARPGPTARTAMLALISLLNLTTLVWAGLSRDTATELSHLLQPLLYTLPPRSAGGTMELSPSPLAPGPKPLSPPMLLELVFVRTKGSTNARDTPTAFGARWLPMNQKRLLTGPMLGPLPAIVSMPWPQRLPQVYHQQKVHPNLLPTHPPRHPPRHLLRRPPNPLPTSLLRIRNDFVGNLVSLFWDLATLH